ncbi:MAG: hypothetical protein SOZ83_03375 [Sphaerochaetaceae bacterium]|nr:hypothetical protein [Sphaerochaetaceae bacterium]
MAKKITIFLLIMFIVLLAFSFITLRIIRKFDVSSVGTKGFSSPTDTQIYNSAIEKVQTTKGYENDVIPSNPLVISSLTDSYTHFVAPVEDIVLVPPPVEVPPVVEVPDAPSMRDVSVTLPDSSTPQETPTVETPVEVPVEVPSQPVYAREPLSTQKAESRLEDILEAYKVVADPGEVVASLDTDTTSAILTDKDRKIARKAMYDAALEKINNVINSDEAKDFVWVDPNQPPENIVEDLGIY